MGAEVKTNLQLVTFSIVYCIQIDECDHASKISQLSVSFQGRTQQAQTNVDCTIPIKIEKSIYSNITVKYSINAVNQPCCAQPTYKSSYAPACNVFAVQRSASSNFYVHIVIHIVISLKRLYFVVHTYFITAIIKYGST